MRTDPDPDPDPDSDPDVRSYPVETLFTFPNLPIKLAQLMDCQSGK